jgi:DNA-binding response OmpR family regulator
MPHILIVEDEPTTSWALAEGLSDDGFTIDTFRSAEDAWTWLQRGRSDLVICDLMLPGMSGIELARRIQRGRHAQPVILVTAYASGDVETMRNAGIVDCFPKPFQMDLLRRSVQNALTQPEPKPRRRRRKAAC